MMWIHWRDLGWWRGLNARDRKGAGISNSRTIRFENEVYKFVMQRKGANWVRVCRVTGHRVEVREAWRDWGIKFTKERTIIHTAADGEDHRIEDLD